MILTLESPATSKDCEKAIVFGDDANLVGVHCVPNSDDFDTKFAVIMITPGMLPSSGPFRMHRQIAIRLAGVGIQSLRFDLSGIGESLAVGAQGSSLDRAANEIRAAIDFLGREHGVEKVALFGLCSGADDALYAALQHERIVGLFSVDGLGYRTAQFYFHRFVTNHLPKLMSGRAWKSRWNRLMNKQSSIPDSLRPGFDIREFPDRNAAVEQLSTLVNRGIKLHFHYTGGVGDYYNHAAQFKQMFAGTKLASEGGLEQISTSYHPNSDHVSFLIEHRELVVQMATDWFLQAKATAAQA